MGAGHPNSGSSRVGRDRWIKGSTLPSTNYHGALTSAPMCTNLYNRNSTNYMHSVYYVIKTKCQH